MRHHVGSPSHNYLLQQLIFYFHSPSFCEYEPGDSPGTSKLQNGCVWSCGTTIINTAVPPSQFARIGYYETWNFNRECLHQTVANANTDGSYTHIHCKLTLPLRFL
jgi:hypothetical protein